MSRPRRFRDRAAAGPARRGALLALTVAAAGIVIGSLLIGPWGQPLVATDGPERQIAGYLVPWDHGAGRTTMWEHAAVLTEVNPVWFALGPDGRLQTTGGPGPVNRLEVPRGSAIALVPTVSNHHGGGWDPDAVAAILRDSRRREHHAAVLADLAARYDWDGIDLDYEFLHPEDREAYTAFVTALAARLHADGRSLSVAVHAKTTDAGEADFHGAYDYAALGAAADTLRIMTYDRHWAGSEPGPIAPSGWVDDVLAYASERVPAERLALGLAAYGYDWADGGAGDLTAREAVALAVEHDATVRWDPTAAGATFAYTADDGTAHTVWFEDARSATAKLEIAAEHGVRGVFVWRLGGEDPGLWGALAPSSETRRAQTR